ncbi:MAG: hypothetical protein IH840_06810, partial [Candidatus Heimdallarchaeota archaeon]|nr:hypothetical protein [Candidatus Heimdallarchaeota archaeon]
RNGLNNNEHFNWIGSVYYHFNAGNIKGAVFDVVNNTNPHPITVEMLRLGYSRIATSYRSHEDNELITPNAHIIADWDVTFTERARGIKIYEKFPEGPYGGSLIHFGFFGSNYFAGSYSSRVALVKAIFHQAGYLDSPWIRYPYDGAVLNGEVILDFSDKWQTSVYLDGSSTLLTKGSDLSYLAEGNHTVEVDFMIDDVLHRRAVSFVIDRTPPSFRFNGNTSLNLPDDLTITPLLISMVDDNSELMKVIHNREDIPYSGLYQVKTTGEQLSLNYATNIDTKYIIFEGYDSAGNQNLTVVPYNTSATIADLPKYMQPSHTRVNLTSLRVDIPIISDTMTAYLDISDNYGVTWTKYEFTEFNSSSNLQSAYYNRGKASIWYRVGVINNGSTLYYRNIKSYQWDTIIPVLQSHNLSSYPNADNPFEIDFRLSQYQNMNVTLHYFDQSNEVVFTGVTTSYSSTNFKVLGKIPTLEDGFYKLVIVLNSGFSNTSFTIPIQIQQKFVSEPIKNYSVGVFETFQINLQNLAGEVKLWTAVIQEEDKILLAVSSEYITSIILNFQTVRNLILSVISNGGKLIKAFHIESILDTSAPEIIGKGLVSYFEELQHSKFVNWTLNDQSGGFYALYLDSIIILSGEWTDGSNVSVDTQDFQIGSYNLTLHARDYYDNELVFTTLLDIHPGIPESPESLVETDTTILSVNNSSLSQTTNPNSSELSDPLSTSLDKSTNGDSNYMPGWLVVATLGVVPSYRLFLRKMKMKR